MSLTPIPEVRQMVEVARKYVAGDLHFSYLVGPTEACVYWARVHGAHYAIQAMAQEWQLLVDRTWNEYGQHARRLPEAELRRRIARDLGVSLTERSAQ